MTRISDGPEFHFPHLAAIQYLAGILKLPAFWGHESDDGKFHDVLEDIYRTALSLLADADSNNDDVEETYAWRRPSLDSIDALVVALLMGLKSTEYQPRTLNELLKQLSRFV